MTEHMLAGEDITSPSNLGELIRRCPPTITERPENAPDHEPIVGQFILLLSHNGEWHAGYTGIDINGRNQWINTREKYLVPFGAGLTPEASVTDLLRILKLWDS